MFALRYNKEQNLNLTEKHLNYLIENSDLKHINKNVCSALMFALRYNKEQNLNLNEKQFNHLIENSNLKQQTNDGWNTLMFALRYNKEQNLNLTEKQLYYLTQKSDLKQQNDGGWNALMYALRYNKEQNLNLTEQQLYYLTQKSDLKQQNDDGWNTLMLALRNNKDENLNLTKQQLNYLTQNSNLKQQNNNGWNALMFALRNHKEQNLNLTEQQLDYIIENSDLKQIDNKGSSNLMFALRYKNNLNLTAKHFDYLIRHSDFSLLNSSHTNYLYEEKLKFNTIEYIYHKYINKDNMLSYIIENKINTALFTSNDWKKVFTNFNNKLDQYYNNTIMQIINNNIQIPQPYIYYILQHTNLNHTNFNQKNILHLLFEKNYYLSSKNLTYLLKNFDLNALDDDHHNALYYAFMQDNQQLNEQQYTTLINKTNLLIKYKNSHTALSIYLSNYKKIKLNHQLIKKLANIIINQKLSNTLILDKLIIQLNNNTEQLQFVFPFINNKNWFISYIENFSFDTSKLLNLPEIISYKEKIQLQIKIQKKFSTIIINKI